MCSRITSLNIRAYKVQTAKLTLYKQHKTTNLGDVSDIKKLLGLGFWGIMGRFRDRFLY